jgi:acetyltransferase-like isoleucine patch superfamily enzyme
MHVCSNGQKELRRCFLAPLLTWGYRYRILRQVCAVLATALEGGCFYSSTLRDILRRYHDVELGAYSYTPSIMTLRGLRPHVTIGRYVSIGRGFRVFLQNHPYDRLSMHPFFYSAQQGFLKEDAIDYSATLTIGNDVWIAENVLVTPGCKVIGHGAVVGAGAVVTRDVPDFAIVAGVPARVIRYRFPEATRELILKSRWWESPVSECVKYLESMTCSLGDEPQRHPLLSKLNPQ